MKPELLYKPGLVWDVLPSIRIHYRPAPLPWQIEVAFLCAALFFTFRHRKNDELR